MKITKAEMKQIINNQINVELEDKLINYLNLQQERCTARIYTYQEFIEIIQHLYDKMSLVPQAKQINMNIIYNKWEGQRYGRSASNRIMYGTIVQLIKYNTTSYNIYAIRQDVSRCTKYEMLLNEEQEQIIKNKLFNKFLSGDC